MAEYKIELPECGILLGNAIYNNHAGYMQGCGWFYSCWCSDSTTPLELVDLTVKENQGNLVQFWWFDGTKRPQTRANFLALEDLNITIPEPDFKNRKNVTLEEFDVFEKYNEERAGAGVLKALERAKELGLYSNMIYCYNVNPEISKKFRTLAPSYIGYDFGERFSFHYATGEATKTEGITLRALADGLIERVSAHIKECKDLGYGNICCTSSSFFMDYEVAAGVDFTLFEDCTNELNIASALSRGLCKQFELQPWGAHIANEHYSWLPYENKFRFLTLRAEMCMKYLAGAKIIISESGAWFCQTTADNSPQNKTPRILKPLGYTPDEQWMPLAEEAEKYFPELDINCEHSRNYRKVMSDFYDFVKANGTPEGQPQVNLAIAKGNLDLCSLSLNGYAPTHVVGGVYDYALENPRWYENAPERGWELVSKVFFPRAQDVYDIERYNRLFSGTPWGQVDIVSFVNDLITPEFLVKNYKALLFAGWNTCSEKQYNTLLEYVKQGGKLFISLPHFSTDIARNYTNYKTADLVRGGDLSELCGVKVKGPGVRFYWANMKTLTENCLGKTRFFGVFSGRIANVELTDPDMEVLLFDAESCQPILLRRELGKGEVYFLNTWEYPGYYADDFGPSAVPGSVGMIGTTFRYLAKITRGETYITEKDADEPGRECTYINYSSFPEQKTICMFNVDFTKAHTFDLHHNGGTETVTLEPQEMRILKGDNIIRYHMDLNK